MLKLKTDAALEAYEGAIESAFAQGCGELAVVMAPRLLVDKMIVWPIEVYKAGDFPYDAEKAARKHVASIRTYEENGYEFMHDVPKNAVMYPEEVMLYKKAPKAATSTQVVNFRSMSEDKVAISTTVTWRTEKNVLYLRLEVPTYIHEGFGPSTSQASYISRDEVNIGHPVCVSASLNSVLVIGGQYNTNGKTGYSMLVSLSDKRFVLTVLPEFHLPQGSCKDKLDWKAGPRAWTKPLEFAILLPK